MRRIHLRLAFGVGRVFASLDAKATGSPSGPGGFARAGWNGRIR